jgi:hypothetical protein
MRLAALAFLLAPGITVAGGGLSSKDKAAAKEMLKGTLYLRIDIPCVRGSKGCSVWAAPRTAVSPTALSVTADGGVTDPRMTTRGGLGAPLRLSGTPYWGFAPNDRVRRYGMMQWREDTVVIWLKGLSPGQGLVPVLLYEIRNLADFEAAFDRAFATAPLDEEHPEWPAEVRKAIAERRVIESMTKRQAFCVVGLPDRILASMENGIEKEEWFPRQQNGALPGFAKPAATGFPAVLRFTNGKLAAIEQPMREEPTLN